MQEASLFVVVACDAPEGCFTATVFLASLGILEAAWDLRSQGWRPSGGAMSWLCPAHADGGSRRRLCEEWCPRLRRRGPCCCGLGPWMTDDGLEQAMWERPGRTVETVAVSERSGL